METLGRTARKAHGSRDFMEDRAFAEEGLFRGVSDHMAAATDQCAAHAHKGVREANCAPKWNLFIKVERGFSRE